MLIFLYFNCANTVGVYNGEIDTFTDLYGYELTNQTIASMLNCVAGISGSIMLGKYLDETKCFKKLQIYISVAITFFIIMTYIFLQFEFPQWVVVVWTIIAGAPVSSVSVVSYQFAPEVSYPISEVQAVSLMNVVNKLVTFAAVKLNTAMTDHDENPYKYSYGFFLWIALSVVSIVPALFVEEDLRRLNMKDVKKSEYVYESALMRKTVQEKALFYKEHRIIAPQEVIDHFFIISSHKSYREDHKTERMTTEDQDRMLSSKRRRSEDLRTSGNH
jgi:hypothetical protein